MNDTEARDYARHLIYFTAYGFRLGSQLSFIALFNRDIAPIIEDYPLVRSVCPFDPAVVDWTMLSAAAGVWTSPDTVAYFPMLAVARSEQSGYLMNDDVPEDIAEFTQRFAQAMVDGSVRHGWCGAFEELTDTVCRALSFTLPPPSGGVSPDPREVPPYLLDSQSK